MNSYPDFLMRELLARIYVHMARGAPRHHRLVGFAEDHITSRIALFGLYERDLIAAVLTIAKKNCTPDKNIIVDVGANIGNHAVAFAASADVENVLAFEPHPALFRILQLNCEMNACTRVVSHNFGLSDTNDSLPYRVGSRSNVGEGHFASSKSASQKESKASPLFLPVRRGDEVLEPDQRKRIRLIKVDTEGHELAVIRGLEGTLTTYKPLVAFESRERQDLDGCTQALRDYGYKYFYAYDYPFRGSPRLPRVLLRMILRTRARWCVVDPGLSTRADFPLLCASATPLSL